MPRKRRSDSVIGSLAPEVREEVDRMLFDEGQSLQVVVDFLWREHNVKLSTMAVSAWRTSEEFRRRARQAQDIAGELRKLMEDGPVEFEEVVKSRLAQRAFELSLGEGSADDIELLAVVQKMLRELAELELARRRTAIAERKAAVLDDAVREVNERGELSAETIEKMTQAARIMS